MLAILGFQTIFRQMKFIEHLFKGNTRKAFITFYIGVSVLGAAMGEWLVPAIFGGLFLLFIGGNYMNYKGWWR